MSPDTNPSLTPIPTGPTGQVPKSHLPNGRLGLPDLFWFGTVLLAALFGFGRSWDELHLPGQGLPGVVIAVVGFMGFAMLQLHLDKSPRPLHGWINLYLFFAPLPSAIISLVWSSFIGASIIAPIVATGLAWLFARLVLATYRKLRPNSTTS